MSEHKSNEAVPVVYPPYLMAQPADDEIDLIDLWIKLRRYKRVFWSVFAVFVGLSLLFAFFVFEERYELKTTIQIGTIDQEKGRAPLEAPESLVNKVKAAIVPAQTKAWAENEGYDERKVKTEVSSPKKSNLVIIANKVKEPELEMFQRYQTMISEHVLNDHRRLFESILAPLSARLKEAELRLKELENPLTLKVKLKPLEIQLEQARIKLDKLEDEKFFGVRKREFKNKILAKKHELDQLNAKGKLLQAQLERTAETAALLSRYIEDLRKQISSAVANLARANSRATESSALSQLLISNEIQQNQQRLLKLEERYEIGLKNERDDLLKQIEANQRAIVDTKKEIDVLNQKYDQLLLDNKLQVKQQKLVVSEAQLAVDKARLNHENDLERQRQQVAEIRTRLDNYDETRVVQPPVASPKPAGLSRTALLALGVFMAGFLGFMAMLMAMFRDRVREKELEAR